MGLMMKNKIVLIESDEILRQYLKETNLVSKKNILILLLSFLLSLIVFSGPIAILVNFIILQQCLRFSLERKFL